MRKWTFVLVAILKFPLSYNCYVCGHSHANPIFYHFLNILLGERRGTLTPRGSFAPPAPPPTHIVLYYVQEKAPKNGMNIFMHGEDRYVHGEDDRRGRERGEGTEREGIVI
jgi:hypothetical protein